MLSTASSAHSKPIRLQGGQRQIARRAVRASSESFQEFVRGLGGSRIQGDFHCQIVGSTLIDKLLQ
jgi:hypothetical protein